MEDDKEDEDYNLSDFSKSDYDINEDFGMEDDGINREIGGKQLEGKQQGVVYKEKEWAIRTIIYFLELKSNQHILKDTNGAIILFVSRYCWKSVIIDSLGVIFLQTIYNL